MVKNQKNPLFLIESQYYRKLKGANIGFPRIKINFLSRVP
jgi:hypothetical protein